MNFHTGDIKGKKRRTMEDAGDDNEDSVDDITKDTTPRILRRHYHRRHNVAIDAWGLELLSSLGDSPDSNDTKEQPFSAYKSILRHNNLFFQFALRLPFSSLIDLYAIDKEFHYRFNKYSVSLINNYARHNAPIASHVFSWALYPGMRISDPMLKPMNERHWLARDVPGLRWIDMILWRQNIVRSILTMLSIEGHRVPAACEATLMKFWCLMETNTTKKRLSFLQNKKLWSDSDIINFQLFLVKLDMRFSDPIMGNGAGQLAHLLLSQKSLSKLWEVLSGTVSLEYDDIIKMILGTHPIEDLNTDDYPWLLDPDEDDDLHGNNPLTGGLLSFEYWHEDGARMPSALHLVIVEGIRRDLHVQKYLIDFVLYGFVDEITGKNLPVPRRLRGETRISVPSEGWPEQSVRDILIRELNDRFGVLRDNE